MGRQCASGGQRRRGQPLVQSLHEQGGIAPHVLCPRDPQTGGQFTAEAMGTQGTARRQSKTITSHV